MITRYTNIHVYNTSQRIFERLDVYTKDSIFYYIGDENIPYDVVIDGHNSYMIPGLIDSHMHIESSMTTPQEFSNTVLPLGTTTILADAHEVGNVFGYDGLIEYMNQDQLLDIFYAIPSSVPSTNSRLETTGGIVDKDVTTKLAKHPKVIALGEIMNFKDVTSDTLTPTQEIIQSFKKALPNHPIEGHIPRISGLGLAKFIHQGIGSDHTQQTVDSLIEKTRAGLLIQLQEKSLSQEIIDEVLKRQLLNRVALVTDDVMPDDLVNKGHMNHLIRRVMDYGMTLEDAVYISTYTPSVRLNLNDRGMIAPGKLADFILLEDTQSFKIKSVFKKGTDVSLLPKDSSESFNSLGLNSIKRDTVRPEDFQIKSNKTLEKVRVIFREAGSTFTQEEILEIPVKNGLLQWKEAGLNLMCVVERYGHNAPLKFGFVKNGFTQPCAIATSWAHDHHNILVMGTDEKRFANVINNVIQMQGGIAIETDTLFSLPLSYGGIVSTESMDILAQGVATIRETMKQSGYTSHNELMSFAVLSLLVSPNLKMSDKGYIDVLSQEILDWSIS